MAETNTYKPRYVLGVDPGTTTGLTLVVFPGPDSNPEFQWQDQLPWVQACNEVERRLRWMRAAHKAGYGDVVVACEKFQLNADTAKRGQKPAEDAMGMVGVVRRYCDVFGVELAKPEQASAAKTLVRDETLVALNLYAVGMKHANDAARHCVLLATKRGWMSKRLLAAGLPK